MERKYKICGYDVWNKRFTIYTNTPKYFNILKGNIWENRNGKWKLVKRVKDLR